MKKTTSNKLTKTSTYKKDSHHYYKIPQTQMKIPKMNNLKHQKSHKTLKMKLSPTKVVESLRRLALIEVAPFSIDY